MYTFTKTIKYVNLQKYTQIVEPSNRATTTKTQKINSAIVPLFARIHYCIFFSIVSKNLLHCVFKQLFKI